jgi:hypothetical protein
MSLLAEFIPKPLGLGKLFDLQFSYVCGSRFSGGCGAGKDCILHVNDNAYLVCKPKIVKYSCFSLNIICPL